MCLCINKKTTYKDIRNKLIKSYIDCSGLESEFNKEFLGHAIQYTYAIINYWSIQQKYNTQEFEYMYTNSQLNVTQTKEPKEYKRLTQYVKNILMQKEHYNIFSNGLNKNFIQISDIHGDLNSLLMSLVGNKHYVESKILPCKFVNNEPCVVYFDIKNGKTIKNPDNINNYTNLVPIPNLEINPDFEGKFILNGDLIDKGLQSEVCFYTMYSILQQEKAKGKIFYLLGNHESLLISEDFNSNILNTSTSFFSSGKSIFYLYNKEYYVLSAEKYDILKSRLQKMCIYLKKLIEDNKLVYSTVIGNVLFSHTYLNGDVVVNLIKELIEYKKNTYEKQYSDILKIYNNKIAAEKNATTEKSNELSATNIQCISNLLNESVKSYINMEYIEKSKCAQKELCSLYARVFTYYENKPCSFLHNLLWLGDRKKIKHLVCNQIIGHIQTYNNALQFEYIDKDDVNILYTDTARCRDISPTGHYLFLQNNESGIILHASDKTKYSYSSLLNIVHDYGLMKDVKFPDFTINNFMPIQSFQNKLDNQKHTKKTNIASMEEIEENSIGEIAKTSTTDPYAKAIEELENCTGRNAKLCGVTKIF